MLLFRAVRALSAAGTRWDETLTQTRHFHLLMREARKEPEGGGSGTLGGG